MVSPVLVRVGSNHPSLSLDVVDPCRAKMDTEQMNKDNTTRLIWFAVGFWAAILTEIIATQIVRFVSSLETDGTVITLLSTPNGNASPKGDEITSVVKETPEHE
jgi:hypothetical protein